MHTNDPVKRIDARLYSRRAEDRGEVAGHFFSMTNTPIISIAELEKQAILNTIRQLNGDKLMAARLLGIGKTTLYRKLKEYGISEEGNE